MRPGRYNYRIVQGDTFQNVPVWKINSTPVNVTGFTARMQIRRASTSTTSIIELTSENGGITVGTVDGSFTLFMSPETTTNLPTGDFVYDLEVTSPDAVVTTLLNGGFTVNPQVTQ